MTYFREAVVNTQEMLDLLVRSQRLFELQGRVDGVDATHQHRDAVAVAARESTRRAREPRQFRDRVC